MAGSGGHCICDWLRPAQDIVRPGYPPGKDITPPRLLCPSAFQEQLSDPLAAAKDSHHRMTFVILPTNFVTLSVIDVIQRWDWRRNRVFSHDVGDSWNFNPGWIPFPKNLTKNKQCRFRSKNRPGYSPLSTLTQSWISQWEYSSSAACQVGSIPSTAVLRIRTLIEDQIHKDRRSMRTDMSTSCPQNSDACLHRGGL